ncbi:MAG TPA: glycosyltransferase family 2 protein [Chitinophagaceae bacterium]|nr:glycosyltransferase family 2 protein [Chitinophagaceae bacterium]
MSNLNSSISICIPAYKRSENINRLLQSISIQTYKHYEIVVTDDSPDDSVRHVLQKYSDLPICYYKNEQALGTPANWNFAISKANGEWIKIMHDDDWFAAENSLEIFAREMNRGRKFIFSAYNNVFEGKPKVQKMSFPSAWRNRIIENPVTLLPRNVIGPPSVTMVHSSLTETYDTRMKWRVDIDFYIRLLKSEKDFTYIKDLLVNVGISGSQVTNYCIDQPEVELPEGLLLLHKYGVQPLRNILVYDSWWRIIRNVNVRRVKDLGIHTQINEWPQVIIKMVLFQSQIPKSILKIGALSKMLMTCSYLLNKHRLNQ